MQNLKKMVQMDLLTKQKYCRHRKETYGYQRKGREGISWETGTDITHNTTYKTDN